MTQKRPFRCACPWHHPCSSITAAAFSSSLLASSNSAGAWSIFGKCFTSLWSIRFSYEIKPSDYLQRDLTTEDGRNLGLLRMLGGIAIKYRRRPSPKLGLNFWRLVYAALPSASQTLLEIRS